MKAGKNFALTLFSGPSVKGTFERDRLKKKVVLWGFVVVLSFSFLFSLGSLARGVAMNLRPGGGQDFSLRYNEVSCVLSGINPYDIAYGRFFSDVFSAFSPRSPFFKPGLRRVGGYPPWAYSLFALFAVFPFHISFLIWVCLQIVSLIWCCVFFFHRAVKRGFTGRTSLAISLTPLLLFWPISSEFTAWNLGLALPALLLLLIHDLEQDRDVRAGIWFFLLAVKPHLTILLAMVLVFRRKWKTLAVSGILCMAASIPPAISLKTSPVALWLDVVGRHADSGLTTVPLFPPILVNFLRNVLTTQGFILFVLVVVAILVFSANRMTHTETDWIRVLLVPTVLTPLWTYWSISDFCLWIVPLGCYAMAFWDRQVTNQSGLFPCLCAIPLFSTVFLVGCSWGPLILDWFGGRLRLMDSHSLKVVGNFFNGHGATFYYPSLFLCFVVFNWLAVVMAFQHLRRGCFTSPERANRLSA